MPIIAEFSVFQMIPKNTYLKQLSTNTAQYMIARNIRTILTLSFYLFSSPKFLLYPDSVDLFVFIFEVAPVSVETVSLAILAILRDCY